MASGVIFISSSRGVATIPVKAFPAGDLSIDFPSERIKLRNENVTANIFLRFYAEPERDPL